MKPLGVGLVFTPALLRLGLDDHEAVSVLEIEPQTLWRLSRAGGREPYQLNLEVCERLAGNSRPKLFHSIGLPVGGSRPLEAAQVELLRTMSRTLRPAWISDHLSFNSFPEGGSWLPAGFFLPPRQDQAGVAVAAAQIRALSRSLDLPVAFETGVNYLRPRPDELPDGTFFAAVSNGADSGILLDLHNLWTNEVNGRCRAEEVLACLPLERVWEVHLAGGMAYKSHWLDAHSGPIPEPVIALATEWIPRFPNLGAVIFEVLDEHVTRMGSAGIERELARLQQLWTLRPAVKEILVKMLEQDDHPVGGTELASVRNWETTLGALAIGRESSGTLALELRSDPGVEVFRRLVTDTRAAFVSDGLRYTLSLLLGAAGSNRVRQLLDEYFISRPPELFASAEAHGFAQFLRQKTLPIPYLDEVLGFEHALVRAALFREESSVDFEHDPATLFEHLDRGQVPGALARRASTILVHAN